MNILGKQTKHGIMPNIMPRRMKTMIESGNGGNLDQLVLNIFTFLFSKYRRLVSTSFNQGDYYNVVNKLKNHGVSYRTRITSHNTGMAGSSINDLNQYDVFVKKKDEALAEEIINSTFTE